MKPSKKTRPGLEDGGEIDNVVVIQIRKAWGLNPCCTCVSSGACFAEKILSSYYCFCLSWLTGSSGSIAKLCNCQVRVSIGLDGSTIRLIPPPHNSDLVLRGQVTNIKPDESNGTKAGCAIYSCKRKDFLSHPDNANHSSLIPSGCRPAASECARLKPSAFI